MADILIKGLALPKDKLEYLHLIIQDGKVHTAISCGHLTTDKLNVATAIELPPHGRLVDADKLLADHNPNENWDYMVLECIIRNAPTVVEANK